MGPTTEYQAALQCAVAAVQAVGELILHSGSEVTDRKSDRAYDVVTEADVKAEQRLVELLSAFDTSIPIRGEELGGDAAANTTWLIDPIDGTGHFARDMPWATTMVALVVDGDVVASVINNFVTNELYAAAKGAGATKNGHPIRVRNRRFPDVYALYDFDLNVGGNSALLADLERCFPTLNYWSCGHSYAAVAQGSFDGRIVLRGDAASDWDHAPGSLLVSEAGGVVANIHSDAYDYRDHNFIAATPSLFEFLVTDERSPLARR